MRQQLRLTFGGQGGCCRYPPSLLQQRSGPSSTTFWVGSSPYIHRSCRKAIGLCQVQHLPDYAPVFHGSGRCRRQGLCRCTRLLHGSGRCRRQGLCRCTSREAAGPPERSIANELVFFATFPLVGLEALEGAIVFAGGQLPDALAQHCAIVVHRPTEGVNTCTSAPLHLNVLSLSCLSQCTKKATSQAKLTNS